MTIIINGRSVFAMILLSSLVLLVSLTFIVPLPIFADRIVTMHQGSTLAIECDLSSNSNDFIYTTKIFNFDQQAKLIINCERPGGDINLKQDESITLQCLHDNNPLAIPKHLKMNAGELFYVLCE